MKELHRYWYTCGQHVVGIIKCQDEITDEIKYYIGCGFGFNEDVDSDFIMKYGAKFNPEIFKVDKDE